MQDKIIPTKKWSFDNDVTEVFDDMLLHSILQYEIMRKAVFDLGCKYQQQNTAIIDLGSSRGEAIAPFIKQYGAYNTFICIEVSEPMQKALKHRFNGLIKVGIVKVENIDLRNNFPKQKASIILSILTLQFTPIEYRLQILQNIYDWLLPNCAFILVEKVIGASSKIDSQMVTLYHNLKKENGYSQEQIDRKKLSLEGVLVPVTAKWNEEMLHNVGFKQVDCFWRWMNFAGWIAIK
jgi:tRNA (cmo5U34)-methyltransferase